MFFNREGRRIADVIIKNVKKKTNTFHVALCMFSKRSAVRMRQNVVTTLVTHSAIASYDVLTSSEIC